MKKLQIQAFFDKTKGHEKQTRAILKSLSSLTPVNIEEIQVDKGSLAILFQFFFRKLRRPPGFQKNAGGPDLIIGTGSACHLPMLIAGQHYPGAKTVTCMTPEKLLINSFDLCLVPSHDLVKDGPGIFTTIGPPCPVKNQQRHKPDKGLVLIGGIDYKSHHWNTAGIIDQVEKIINRPEVHWTISSSPRTPEDTLQALGKLCARHANSDFFRSENTPPGWIEEQYHENSIAWVTGDSVSMVYEALSAGCQVGILPVEWKQKGNKFQRSLDYLAGKEMIIYSDENDAKSGSSQENPEFNEAARCAKEILNRWWPERIEQYD